jgi:hypothetical protein
VSPARREQFRLRPQRFETSRIFIGRSLQQSGKGIFASAERISVPELALDVPDASYTMLHLGPLVAVLIYAAEPIRSDIPPFPVEAFSFPPQLAHLLRLLLPAKDAVPILWDMQLAILIRLRGFAIGSASNHGSYNSRLFMRIRASRRGRPDPSAHVEQRGRLKGLTRLRAAFFLGDQGGAPVCCLHGTGLAR